MPDSAFVRDHQQTTAVLYWGLLSPSRRSPTAKVPPPAQTRITNMTIASALGPTPHDTICSFWVPNRAASYWHSYVAR